MKVCNLFEGLILKKDDKGIFFVFYFEKLFIFVLMWSLGVLLELDDCVKMEEFFVKYLSVLDLFFIKEGEIIFEYVVDDYGILLLLIVV